MKRARQNRAQARRRECEATEDSIDEIWIPGTGPYIQPLSAKLLASSTAESRLIAHLYTCSFFFMDLLILDMYIEKLDIPHLNP